VGEDVETSVKLVRDLLCLLLNPEASILPKLSPTLACGSGETHFSDGIPLLVEGKSGELLSSEHSFKFIVK